jgi:hypothetical protein
MSKVVSYLMLAICFLVIYPFDLIAQNGDKEKNEASRPVLVIMPREVDMGTIGSGEDVSESFTFKNVGSGIMGWSTSGPEGWKVSGNERIAGTLDDRADYLRVDIHVAAGGNMFKDEKSRDSLYQVTMTLEAGKVKLVCKKTLAMGNYKEAIKINSVGGNRTIFINFKIVSAVELPQINLNPVRLDMGFILPGKTISKKIMLTNKGREILRWNVAVQKYKRGDSPASFKKGRYISFVNEDIRGSGTYSLPANLKEIIELNGKWIENGGYPSSTGTGNSLNVRFSGTGIILCFINYPDKGNLAVYVDERQINENISSPEQRKNNEMLIAEGLVDGPHVLTVVTKEGRLDIEGIKILGRDVARGPQGWVNVFPVSGTTTQEIDYINVHLNTAQLSPGLYSDNIIFNSNGGDGTVEIFVEVVADKATKSVDIYRYAKGLDYLFTANPQAETKRLNQNEYVKEGIAFRLFMPDTPGTTSFYRWYNPQKMDHFYHYDARGGGKKLQGYVFEGSIGNIATSRMTNTKELYRWYNPESGQYFYTTDSHGEKAAKKGYKFDGIAGYVK